MAWQLTLTDTAGRNVALLGDYQSFTLTSVLNDAATLTFTLNANDPTVAQLSVGERAVKAYQNGVLRFYGKVWEPLRFTSGEVTVTCKDPFAEFAQRRVRTSTTYTGTDAGAIAQARVTAQNTYLNTFLGNGTVQASMNRDRTYDPGKLEGEIVTQLSEVSNGFFFKAVPVDNNPALMGNLWIFYPNAGTTREGVRFEYGPNTRDNLDDYDLSYGLPLNRFTAASSGPTGGRISSVADDTVSQARYGLFENEQAFSDVSVLATLTQHATAQVEVSPPLTIGCTPSVDAPILFTDFVTGDFVRVLIQTTALNTGLLWTRVLEASITVDVNGVETLSGVGLEVVAGATLNIPPEKQWRTKRDESLSRLEALERRVENQTQVVSAPPTAPAPIPPVPDPVPPEPPTPPAPPPPPPARAPYVTTNNAYSSYDPVLRAIYVQIDGRVTPLDATTTWWFEGHRDNGSNAPDLTPSGFLWQTPAQAGMPPREYPVTVQARRDFLLSNTKYWVNLVAENKNGRTYGNYISFISSHP